MAGGVGTDESSVPLEFIRLSTRALEDLMGRCLEGMAILVLDLDGIAVAGHHILAMAGIEGDGGRHLPGLSHAKTENARLRRCRRHGLTNLTEALYSSHLSTWQRERKSGASGSMPVLLLALSTCWRFAHNPPCAANVRTDPIHESIQRRKP